MALCRVCRSRTFQPKLMPFFGSVRRRLISLSRSISSPGSWKRRADQPSTRSSTAPADVLEGRCRLLRPREPSGPTVIVVDASVIATALADDGRDGDKARHRLRGELLHAPDLIDLEVTSVLRGRLSGGHLDARRAALALEDLRSLPLRRVAALELIGRCWELRDNLTVYDAAYIALAEMLNLTLLTGDAKMAKAPGPRCSVEILR